MSNEFAPDSRQPVDLKWKLRKALEKNVAPRDDGNGLDFGQDVGIDGKLHLNEVSDIVGPDGNALITDQSQENLSAKVANMLTHFFDGRYSGVHYGSGAGDLLPSALINAGASSFIYTFNAAVFEHNANLVDLPTSGCTFEGMFLGASGHVNMTLGNGGGNCSSMFFSSEFTKISVASGKTFHVTNAYAMFRLCASLTSITGFDFSGCREMRYMLSYCTALTELNVSGMQFSFDISPTALAHDALVVVINNLATVTTAQTLTMGSNKLALLSDAEKLGATNKGWTLA